MAYLPPVNIPDLGQPRDYAGQLYGMLNNTGQAFYQNRRDKVGDAQWEQEQERLSTAQALGQSNADRNYALELEKFKADQAAADEYYAGQWVFNDETQTWGMAQPSKGGGPAALVGAPDGYRFMPPTSNANLGDTIQPVTTRGGVPIPGAALPVNNAAEAADRERGSIEGASQGALPGAKKNMEYISMKIQEMYNDPDLGLVTGGGGAGGFGGILPTDFSIWADTRDKGRDVQSRLDFLQSQVFPVAYDLIRGAGPIAIYEGQAAAAAISRLKDQNLSDEDYKAALLDLDQKLKAMLAATEAKAGGAGGQPITSPGGVQFRRMGQ